jgi:hypothetical protein
MDSRDPALVASGGVLVWAKRQSRELLTRYGSDAGLLILA